MGLTDQYREQVEDVGESLEESFSYRNALDLKVFLDNILPFIFMLVSFIIIFEFFLPVNSTMEMWIQWANWTVISYFGLRLLVEFKLSGSRNSFLKDHWFDMLLVVPTFSILREARLGSKMAEMGLISVDEGAYSMAGLRNTGAAARMTRISRIVKRSV